MVESSTPSDPSVPSIPSSVRIGLVSYRVTDDADDWLRIEHETQKTGYYGFCNHKRAMIYLNPEATAEVTRMSLWHEILHCLCEVTMGSPDWRHLGSDGPDREESVVRRFEAPTLAVLRDNPDLAAYLVAG